MGAGEQQFAAQGEVGGFSCGGGKLQDRFGIQLSCSQKSQQFLQKLGPSQFGHDRQIGAVDEEQVGGEEGHFAGQARPQHGIDPLAVHAQPIQVTRFQLVMQAVAGQRGARIGDKRRAAVQPGRYRFGFADIQKEPVWGNVPSHFQAAARSAAQHFLKGMRRHLHPRQGTDIHGGRFAGVGHRQILQLQRFFNGGPPPQDGEHGEIAPRVRRPPVGSTRLVPQVQHAAAGRQQVGSPAEFSGVGDGLAKVGIRPFGRIAGVPGNLQGFTQHLIGGLQCQRIGQRLTGHQNQAVFQAGPFQRQLVLLGVKNRTDFHLLGLDQFRVNRHAFALAIGIQYPVFSVVNERS